MVGALQTIRSVVLMTNPAIFYGTLNTDGLGRVLFRIST